MGKVYLPPKGWKSPSLKNYKDINQYFKDCDTFVFNLKKAVKAIKTCPEAGEEIQFPVADGYARYIVASLKPVKLIHINTGDAWHYQYVHRLTARDIKAEIKKNKAFKKIFG